MENVVYLGRARSVTHTHGGTDIKDNWVQITAAGTESKNMKRRRLESGTYVDSGW